MSENFDLDTGKNIVDALKADVENEELELTEDVEFEDVVVEETEDVEETFEENDEEDLMESFEEVSDVNKFDSSMKPSSD